MGSMEGRRPALPAAMLAAVVAALIAAEEERTPRGGAPHSAPAPGAGAEGSSGWRLAGRMAQVRGAERLMLMRGGRRV
ncbi:MAG: hypothetical protein QJR08_00865 [Bacillota bacterium]|nr:hypothetical protein [Bacillota bacterium]